MTTSEIAPDAYAPLKRAADEGRVKLLDLGVGYDADSLWFNLKPGAFAAIRARRGCSATSCAARSRWRSIASCSPNTVFLGAGVPVYGPETPANKKWYWTDVPKTPHDPERREEAARVDRPRPIATATACSKTRSNQPARFTLLTQKGRPDRERGAVVIRDELKKIGLVVDVVALDAGAVIQRFLSAKYDAVYFGADKTDLDPAINPDFWFSSGSAHVWNIAPKTPATEWERRIDELMARQIAAPDERERKRLFDEVQKIFAEHLPIVYFAAPRIYVASSSRVDERHAGGVAAAAAVGADRVAVTR